MPYPILLLVGQAGSGKDTVANILAESYGYAAVAFADKMKQLARSLFNFTDDQLWGPSSSRNAEDFRYKPLGKAWDNVFKHKNTYSWLDSLELLYIPGMEEVNNLAYFCNWLRKFHKDLIEQKRTLTPRIFLQALGTEWGRNLSKTLWSDYAIKTSKKLLLGGYKYDKTIGLIEDSSFPGYNGIVISDGRFRSEMLAIQELGGKALKLINPVDESYILETAGIKGHASEAEQKSIPDDWFDFIYVNDKSFGLESLKLNIEAIYDRLFAHEYSRYLL